MKLLVQKYGGSILQSPEYIKKVADHIIETKKRYSIVLASLGI